MPHELLLTTRQKTKLRNALNNNMSTDSKLSKAQIAKIIQSGGFLASLLSKLAGPLTKVANSFSKKCFSFIRNYSCCLGNWCRNSKKNTHGSGTKTLIISNEEINDIMKIIQALENSNILIKEVTKTINETKEQKGGILSMLLGILGASLWGNLLTGKGIVRAGSENKKGKGIVRATSGKQWDF